MKFFLRAFTPTKNRRLNELIGFILFVAATLLFLSLASYSPVDASLNTAASPLASHPAHNWIGLFGALLSDVLLQFSVISIFVVPVCLAMLAARWFKSREVASPVARTVGAVVLMVFLPAALGLLPEIRWRHAVPIEGLLGRITSDILLHYFNLIGAWIVCGAVIAVAAWQRFQDWREARAKNRARKQQEKGRGEKPVVTTQFAPARRPVQAAKSSVEEENDNPRVAPVSLAPKMETAAARSSAEPASEAISIGSRADGAAKAKTVMPK